MLIVLIFLITAIPVGYLIAYLARDELVQGRKYFKGIILFSLIFIIYAYILNKPVISLTALFIILTTSISLYKSWIKKLK